MLSFERNSPESDVLAVIFRQTLGQVVLGHAHAARIIVAYVKDNQIASVVILCNIVNRGRAAEAVHYAKPDAVLVQHRSKHAADGALLAPHLYAHRLLGPEVSTIRPAYGVDESGGIV